MLDDGSQYVYGLGLVSQVSGSNTYYYLSDGLGSTVARVDGGGSVVKTYAYDVYGKVTSSSGSVANEFDFAGQQTDPTGLQYLRARYYDPETGTFLSRDPLSAAPGWGGQPFGYADANPALLADPTGLIVWDGNDYSSCSFGCTKFVGFSWIFSMPGVDPDTDTFTLRVPDGWWVQAWSFDDKLSHFEVCHFVGEYRRCNGSDDQTKKTWNTYLDGAKDLIAISAAIKQTADFWRSLKPYRGGLKTNGLKGKHAKYYEWDYTHKNMEVYDSNGKHLGSADPVTGEIRPNTAKPGRRMPD